MFELLWMSFTNRLTSFSWVFLISETLITLASSRQQLNLSVKVTRNCTGFLDYGLWLVEIISITLSATNQILNWNQSRIGHLRWHVLCAVSWLLLRVLIGRCDNMLSATNQILNWNQSRIGHSRWQVLCAVSWLLLRVLIGRCDNTLSATNQILNWNQSRIGHLR